MRVTICVCLLKKVYLLNNEIGECCMFLSSEILSCSTAAVCSAEDIKTFNLEEWLHAGFRERQWFEVNFWAYHWLLNVFKNHRYIRRIFFIDKWTCQYLTEVLLTLLSEEVLEMHKCLLLSVAVQCIHSNTEKCYSGHYHFINNCLANHPKCFNLLIWQGGKSLEWRALLFIGTYHNSFLIHCWRPLAK